MVPAIIHALVLQAELSSMQKKLPLHHLLI